MTKCLEIPKQFEKILCRWLKTTFFNKQGIHIYCVGIWEIWDICAEFVCIMKTIRVLGSEETASVCESG